MAVELFWPLVIVVAAPLARQLTDAQENDTDCWLPGSTESTQVLDVSGEFRPEAVPTIVVYAREGGLTAAGRARMCEDVRRTGELRSPGVRGAEVPGPVYDEKRGPGAARIFVPVTVEAEGRERLGPAVDSVRERVGDAEGGPAGARDRARRHGRRLRGGQGSVPVS
ncbi:hypothetical protein [Streptomyces sp. A1499]|uniref:hypothetical protein n=1 Tax=Streptomyces sp. A1499 TaxID=2563104 RepID=UPI001F111E94|nr:hypothetical protein [Streptomyces sp. A1499]